MSEHTAGPWTIEPDAERGGWHIRHYADDVAYIPPSASTDARLIAAAPDLLAALEALCDAPAVPDVYSDLWGDANAALDKAKGTDVGA